MNVVLQAEGLRFAWPGAAPLLRDFSLQLGPGLTWITGEEGSGKSTLLSLLAGERQPQAGRLCAAGHSLAREPERYRRQVFWIDPQTEAHHEQGARDFLAGLSAAWPDWDPELLTDLLGALGLDEHLHKPLYMLSTGSRRKVWLSAAFAARAPVTLIDQPFAALDAPSARMVGECLAEAAELAQRAWLVADHEAPDWPGLRQVALSSLDTAGL